jgi:hypothetical protein
MRSYGLMRHLTATVLVSAVSIGVSLSAHATSEFLIDPTGGTDLMPRVDMIPSLRWPIQTA